VRALGRGGRGDSGAPVEGKAQPGFRVGLAPRAARDGHQPVAHQQHHRDQACAPSGAPPSARGARCSPPLDGGRPASRLSALGFFCAPFGDAADAGKALTAPSPAGTTSVANETR